MHWGEPAGLWLLVLWVPLALLYWLRSRKQAHLVGSLWLWQKVLQRPRERSWRRWLARWSLLLQALAIGALALVASRPTLEATSTAKRVALILDLSASMQTREADGTPRLELAKRRAKEIVRGLHPDAEVLLLGASNSVSVASPFERDRRLLLERLEALRATDLEGRLQPALELAADKLRAHGKEAQLIVITDGVLAEASWPQVADLPLEIAAIGTESDNVGITRADVQAQSTAELDSTLVLVSVKNFGLEPRDVFLTLRQRNVTQIENSRRLRLEPLEERATTLRFHTTPEDQGTGLVLELSPGDAQPVDDRAFAVVPVRSKQPVVLFGERSSPWLERALGADPEVELLRSSAVGFEASAIPLGALAIFNQHCPAELPTTSFLVLDPPPGPCLNDDVGALTEHPEVTHWDEADPRFRFVSLADVALASARRLQPESSTRALLWSRDAPLMLRYDLHDRVGTVVGFDVERSNWPLKASFVVFVRNLVELARHGRARATTQLVRAGEPIRIQVPTDVTEVRVSLPDGSEELLRAANGSALLPETPQAGFHFFSWGGLEPGSALVAANASSERESDPRRDPLPTFAASHTAGSALIRQHRPLAAWLGGLALGLMLLDAGSSLSGARRRARKT